MRSLRGGVNNSLPRSRRKQATATKLRIYSTFSERSPIYFLAHCSTSCKPLKKNQKMVRSSRSSPQQRPEILTKNGDIYIVFSVQRTGGSPTGQDAENRVGDQDNGSPGRQVSSGLQMPGESALCRARTRFPWWTTRSLFPSIRHSIAPAEMSNILRW